MKRGKKYAILAVLGVIICSAAAGINMKAKASVYSDQYQNDTFIYAKDETLLRVAPSSSADVSIVIVKGTKLKCNTAEAVTKGDGTIYDRVEIVADNNYREGHVGYVLRRQLSQEPVESEIRLMYIKNKTKMVQEAMRILNTNTKYNMKAPYRAGGYYGIQENGVYTYDCSTFCSTLMKNTFGLDMLQTNKNKINLNGMICYNVWQTYTYFDEVNKFDSMFSVVDRVTTPGQSIDKSKLQIGDFILGDAKKIKRGVNHIMFYVGEDYIIHATNGGVQRMRLSDDYYTCLETSSNVASGNYTKRFDKEIMILRYRDREINR